MSDNKRFTLRSIACFFLVMLMLLSCFLRVAVIASGNYGELCERQIEYSIEVSKKRGTVYDCNMLPLTNTSQKLVAAISPVDTALSVLPDLLSGDELVRVQNLLKQGKPAVCEVSRQIECEGISYTRVYDASSGENSALHTIGYLDSEARGVSGIQSAYDDLLYSSESVEAVFQLAGDGSILKGIEPQFKNGSLGTGDAVVTTIDFSVQTVAEEAAQGLKKGAVVVCDAQNGKIRAIVSEPSFDINNIAAALDSTDSPLINRALSAFSVGSVFKPCVAAAALEKNISYFTHTCTGSTHIIDRDFKCHYRAGHGTVNMKKAIAYSCNTFFYNFAMEIGVTPIYNMASSLSFGHSLNIADNIKTAKGNLTALSKLSNHASLANLSIGQGDLALSPVSMLTLYLAIAGDGRYYVPSLIEKTIENGVEKIYDIGAETRAFSQKTADTLKECLVAVVEEGTGTAARPQTVSAAGKTATAQTGRYTEDGKEITNSWFCGFFPAEKPKYVAVVLSEGESDVGTTEIFSSLADKIKELGLI